MAKLAGRCRVSLAGDGHWQAHGGGTRFGIPAHSRFESGALEPVAYGCH